MNLKTWVTILVSSFGIILAGSIIGGILDSQGILTEECIGPQGMAAILVLNFILFLLMCFAFIPVVIRVFIHLQLKVGNGEWPIIQGLQQNKKIVVYCLWALFLIGLCISLPAAIRDGLFNEPL